MSTIRVVNIQHSDATEPNIVLNADGTATFVSGITISGGTNLTVSGTAEFASGTVSAPGITFIDDNNTGIYEPAVDTVAVATNGTGRLFVDANGRVGVGTASPQNNFHLSSSSATTRLQITNSTTAEGSSDGTVLIQTGNTFLINNRENDDIYFATNNNEALRITSAGLVGIGTSSPQTLLELSASNSSISSGNPPLNILRFNDTDPGTAGGQPTGRIEFYVNDEGAGGTGVGSFIEGAAVGSTGGGKIRFGTSASGATGASTKVVIDGTGNVGIGTTSPTAPLQIGVGNPAESSSKATFNTANSADAGILIDNWTGSATTLGPRLKFSNSGFGTWYMGGGHGTNTFVIGDSSDRFTIDSSGNVGIGATSATSIGGYTGLSIDNATNGGFVDLLSNGSPAFRLLTNGAQCNVESRTAIPIVFFTNTQERMRLDSAGNSRILIGSSSIIGGTTKDSYYAKVTIRGRGDIAGEEGRVAIVRDAGAASIGATSQIGNIFFSDADGNSYAAIEARADAGASGSSTPGNLKFLTTSPATTNPAERMRIDSAGKLLINATSGVSNEKLFLQYTPVHTGAIINTNSSFSGNSILIEFKANGTTGGSIVFTNNGTSTAYVGSSDYRMKKNVVNLTNAVERVKNLQPKRFNFIASPNTIVDGFLAHEAQTVVPEAVTGVKDEVDGDGNAVMQGIDQAKLVPLLTAALQEAIAKIETLEQRLSDAGIA